MIKQPRMYLNMLIAQIDELIKKQLIEFIQHPVFKQLEARWRGLFYLVEQHYANDVAIKLLTMSNKELKKDLEYNQDYEQTYLYHLIYESEYDMPGGQPYGLLMFDHLLSNELHLDWLTFFNNVMGIAACSFTPVLMNIDPSLFQLEHMSDFVKISNHKQFFESKFCNILNKIGNHSASRYLYFSIQKYLWRQPYHNQYTQMINLIEGIQDSNKLCWGSILPLIANIVIKNFREYGWFSDLNQMQIKPRHFYNDVDIAQVSALSRLECPLPSKTNVLLANLGVLTLCENQYNRSLGIHNMQSQHKQAKGVEQLNDLSSILPFILCIARFAQYLKIIAREKIGSILNVEQLQAYLQTWLYQYCGNLENQNVNLIKYPLKKATLSIHKNPKKATHYLCDIDLSPNFRIDNVQLNLSLKSELKVVRVM